MPPTNILLGISVPYFGTDGEKASGVSGRDTSIITYTACRSKLTKRSAVYLLQYCNKFPAE